MRKSDQEWSAYKREYQQIVAFVSTRTASNGDMTQQMMVPYAAAYEAYTRHLRYSDRSTRSALQRIAFSQLCVMAFLSFAAVFAVFKALREGSVSRQLTASSNALVENLGVPAVVIDDDTGAILDVSAALVKDFGYGDKKDVLGRHVTDVLLPLSGLDFGDEKTFFSRDTTNKSREENIVHGVRKDGLLLDLVATTATRNAERTTTVVCRDVTEFRRKDRDLEVAHQVLRQFAHELRSKYVCALHDLEAIREVYSKDTDDDDDFYVKRRLKSLGVSDESLAAAMTLLHEGDQLIEARMQLHKVYKGAYETRPNVQVVDQATLLGSRLTVARALQSTLHTVDYPIGTPENLSLVSLELDCYVFAHIANNLLSNARKHTTAGTVSLSFLGAEIMTSEKDSKNKKQLLFSVRDTGRGVPAAIASRLFAEEVASADVRGVGLGLLSCRVFAEAIGGKCWLESTRMRRPLDDASDSGTEFRFSLPGEIRMNESFDEYLRDDEIKQEVHHTEDEQQRRRLEKKNRRSTSFNDLNQESPKKLFPASLRAFVVEDSAMLRRCITTKLRAVARTAGAEVVITEHETVESILTTLDTFVDDSLAIVTADQNLDSMGGTLSGSDLVATLRRAGFKGCIVSCSGDIEVGQEHLRLGADLIWGKPLPNTASLLNCLQRFYARQNKRVEQLGPLSLPS